MIAGFVAHHPDPVARGRGHGRRLRWAVRHNVGGFLNDLAAAGWDQGRVRRAVRAEARAARDDEIAELESIADAAGVDREAHLMFALAAHVVAPEECTVAAAVGSAGAMGHTVLLKNSDKIGAPSMVGEGFHGFKEVNVVVDLRSEDGIRTVGVAAAGSTGIKMGVNDAGVAAASNIVRTAELRRRRVGVDDIRALDRGRLLRNGLNFATPWAAAEWAMDTIATTPMATPGNVHFAGPDTMFVIEGSYDRLAMEYVHDRIVVRSNMFVLLAELNDPEDASSPARYARALELLLPHAGAVTEDHLVAVSRDHGNGPGPNSICRHSDDPMAETSLSAMVASLPAAQPATVAFALGKPCWAWRGDDGVLEMTMSEAAVPERFRSGARWRALYREDARLG